MNAPDDAKALRTQGFDALKQQRYDNAGELLRRYLEAVSGDAEAELALAMARSGEGRHAAALVIVERLLERNARSSQAHYTRGTILERLGRRADAMRAYEQAVQLKPDHVKARQRLDALRGADELDDEEIPFAEEVGSESDAPRARRAVRPRRKKSQSSEIPRWVHFVLAGYVVALIVAHAAFISSSVSGFISGGLLSGIVFTQAAIYLYNLSCRDGRTAPLILGLIAALIGSCGLVFMPLAVFAQAAGVIGRQRPPSLPRGVTVTRDTAVDRAIAQLQSGNPTNVSFALGTLPVVPPNGRRTEVVSLLESLLNHSEWIVRAQALNALAKWGTKGSIPKIEPLLSDQQPLVRDNAKRAIAAIERQP